MDLFLWMVCKWYSCKYSVLLKKWRLEINVCCHFSISWTVSRNKSGFLHVLFLIHHSSNLSLRVLINYWLLPVIIGIAVLFALVFDRIQCERLIVRTLCIVLFMIWRGFWFGGNSEGLFLVNGFYFVWSSQYQALFALVWLCAFLERWVLF